jgi:hypothetical protein
MKAYVLINIRTGDVKEVVKNLRRVQGVVEANMTFGPYDAILATAIQPIPGVLETLTCLAVDV